MEDNTLLTIKDLYVSYETDEATVYAVNGVSFELKKGETLGLVGETGAGKTTIARAIMKLIPNPPGKINGGEIIFENQNILNLSRREMQKIRGNKISMIFQDPMSALNPVHTVGEQIVEVIRLHEKCSAAEAQKKAVDMLEMVGIPGERFAEYPHQFSGGMKQRIVIAIALACQPELLIADEPTTALDVTIQAQVLNLMNNLKNDLGTSMIMITHDLGIVAEMCERVLVIYAGKVVELGDVVHIYDEFAHPYTKGLFDSLPNMNDDSKMLHPIPGLMPDPSILPKGCAFAPRCDYATKECEEHIPDLNEIAPGHFVRCFNPLRKEMK